jgi:hypothetical protein
VASLPVTAGREIQITGGASDAPPFFIHGRNAAAGRRAVTSIDPDQPQLTGNGSRTANARYRADACSRLTPAVFPLKNMID